MEQLILGFYTGAGSTLAFSLCLFLWWQARVSRAVSDAYEEGLEDAYTQMSETKQDRIKPAFIGMS